MPRRRKKERVREPKIHYVISIPPEGFTPKLRNLIKSLKKKYGKIHVNFYTTKRAFRTRMGGRVSVTNHWMEISDVPVPIRKYTDWPLGQGRFS